MSRLVPDYLYGASVEADDFLLYNPMYSSDFWTLRDADKVESKLFVALDGLNSGVPTRTTPTLTPTTLRNIEQTFLELQNEQEQPLSQAANQAGFVPPVVHHTPHHHHVQHHVDGSVFVNTESKGGWAGGSATVGRPQSSASPASSLHLQHQATPSPPLHIAPSTSATPAPRRNMGGRRPAKDDKVSPEEAERRKLRRERNKMAAARCRKRRLDHTNELLEETEGLEQKKQCLQSEIQQLQREKEELEFILEAHKPCCRMLACASPPDVKPSRTELIIQHQQQQQQQQQHQQQQHQQQQQQLHRPPPRLLPVAAPSGKQPAQRPSSLNVGSAAFTPAGSKLGGGGALSEVAGVAITTPSAGIPFNFESLMEGGTGLTPVSGLAPSCSSQQRHEISAAAAGDLATSPGDVASSSLPPKLVSL